MLKIGEFSKLSRVSVRMLRHYDEIGLLKPAEIDRFTEYRYYREDQLPTAGRIAALKDMGFSLADIVRILEVYDDRDQLEQFFSASQKELEAISQDTAHKLTLLDAARKRLRKQYYSPATDGFYGAFYECPIHTEKAVILMLGDAVDDRMAVSGVKWLHQQECHVMAMAPDKKDYGHHNYPLERFGKAIEVLQEKGSSKIGIVGASTTGMLALAAASYYPQISLTVAISPSDFIMEGFYQDGKDGMKAAATTWKERRERINTISSGVIVTPLAYDEFAAAGEGYQKMVDICRCVHR